MKSARFRSPTPPLAITPGRYTATFPVVVSMRLQAVTENENPDSAALSAQSRNRWRAIVARLAQVPYNPLFYRRIHDVSVRTRSCYRPPGSAPTAQEWDVPGRHPRPEDQGSHHEGPDADSGPARLGQEV